MNIGIFTDMYRPSINGLTTSVDTFKEQLEKKGHKVYIFAPKVKGTPSEKDVFRLPSISIQDINPKDAPIGVPFRPIVNKIRPLKLDLVHTQLPFLVGYLGHHVANRLNLPEIHTYHTHLTEYAHYVPSKFLQPFIKFGLKRLTRNFCNKSDIVIAPSSAIKDLLENYGVKSTIIINQTGVDLKNFKRLDQNERKTLFEKYNIPTDKKIILFAGRVAKEKNLTFLLRVYKEVLKSDLKIFMVFAGGGPDAEDLQNRVNKMKLQAHVKITGYLEKKEIARFFGSADVFTFPSVTDTQGLVLCEAMAGGTPVIAVDKLGPKDIIKNGIDGFLVRENEKEFAGKIIEVLKDDKLSQTLAENALESVEKFSIENRTDRLIGIYKKAIAEYLPGRRESLWKRASNKLDKTILNSLSIFD